jgi:hypothetical protein
LGAEEGGEVFVGDEWEIGGFTRGMVDSDREEKGEEHVLVGKLFERGLTNFG